MSAATAESDATTAVATPAPQARAHETPQKQPRYNVVLLNDDDHTFDYVCVMLKSLFGYDLPRGYSLATTVHVSGRAVLLTTTREHAELKRDQIHAYGRDELLERCAGSMSAIIEPAMGDDDEDDDDQRDPGCGRGHA